MVRYPELELRGIRVAPQTNNVPDEARWPSRGRPPTMRPRQPRKRRKLAGRCASVAWKTSLTAIRPLLEAANFQPINLIFDALMPNDQ
jgi:hypothetical protein